MDVTVLEVHYVHCKSEDIKKIKLANKDGKMVKNKKKPDEEEEDGKKHKQEWQPKDFKVKTARQ